MKQRSPLGALFLAVMIDLLGFGIVLPLLPQYAKNYGASPAMLALLMSSFSAMQFVFAPMWGRISDRRGRRPVLLVGLCGSVLSYALFGIAEIDGVHQALGLATPIPLILVSRILAGLFGATIGTAYAYIADVTDARSRGKGMALIGVAFGIGFTLGPAVGGWTDEHWGRPAPGFVAAALSFCALLVALRTLTEPERRGVSTRRGWDAFRSLGVALSRKTVASIVALQFLATFCFANMEGTLALFARARLGYDTGDNGMLFAYLGLSLLVAQGFVVRRFLPRVGELRFNVVGCALLAAGLGFVAVSTQQWHAFTALPTAVFGFAMVTTSMASLLSQRTPADMQGEVLGVNQASLSLARIFGPAAGNLLLPKALDDPTNPLLARPFWFAGGLAALAIVWAVVLARTPAPDAPPPAPDTA